MVQNSTVLDTSYNDWEISAGTIHAGAWELGLGYFTFRLRSAKGCIDDGFSILAGGIGFGGNASGRSLGDLRGKTANYAKPKRCSSFSLASLNHSSAVLSAASVGIGVNIPLVGSLTKNFGAGKGFLLLTVNNRFDIEFNNINWNMEDITIGSGSGIYSFAGILFIHSAWTNAVNALKEKVARELIELTPWGSTGPWRGLPF